MDFQTPAPYQPPAPAPSHSFAERVVGALKLQRPIFDEVRRDPGAMLQAAGIVIATGLLSGIGQFATIRGQSVDTGDRTYEVANSFLVPLLGGLGIAVAGLIFWIFGSLLFRFVALKMLGSPEAGMQWQEVARPLGFASAPSLLLILSPIPVVGFLVGSVVGLWSFAAQIVAMSEVFRVSKWRAFAIMLVASIGLALVLSLLLCVCILIATALN